MNDLPYLVAGGGIGGIAAALGLARQGAPVRLFEQAPAFEEVGAGLQMSPNGVRALRELGAWEAVEPACVIPSEIHMRDGRSGALLQRIRLGKGFEQRFGAPYRVCHRADLLAGLLAAARGNAGIELNTGMQVAGVENIAGTPASPSPLAHCRRPRHRRGGRHPLQPAGGRHRRVAPVPRNVTLYRGLIPLRKSAARDRG